MINDLINHASVIISTHKNLKGWESFPVGAHMVSGVPGKGMETPHPFPTPGPIQFFYLAAPELYTIAFYNKPVI